MKAYVHTVEGDFEIDGAGDVRVSGDVAVVTKAGAGANPPVLAAIKLSDQTFVFLGDNPPKKIAG